jgi:hypothetical protein
VSSWAAATHHPHGVQPGIPAGCAQDLDSDAVIVDVGQNGYGSDRTVFSKPALIYDRYNAVVRWVLMPVNAGLEATRENLGSNYPEHLDEDPEQVEAASATEAA